jgi:hypothetical protein
MTYVVTAGHPITLEDGRMVGPGETVTAVKPSDPRTAVLIDKGLLRKKAVKKKAPPKVEPATTEASPPETTEES